MLVLIGQRVTGRTAERRQPRVGLGSLVDVDQIELRLDILGVHGETRAIEVRRPGSVARSAIHHQPPVVEIAHHDVLASGRDGEREPGSLGPFRIQEVQHGIPPLHAGPVLEGANKRGLRPVTRFRGQSRVDTKIGGRGERSREPRAIPDDILFMQQRGTVQSDDVVIVLVARPEIGAHGQPGCRILELLDGFVESARRRGRAGAGAAPGTVVVWAWATPRVRSSVSAATADWNTFAVMSVSPLVDWGLGFRKQVSRDRLSPSGNIGPGAPPPADASGG